MIRKYCIPDCLNIVTLYGEGSIDCLKFRENNAAFKHLEELHNMLEFLKGARSLVSHAAGKWFTWDEPDPLAPPARFAKKTNMPQAKEERSSEVQVEFDVDTSQFAGLTTRQKLDTDLDHIILQNDRRNHRDEDSSSSDDEMQGRRAVILERVEQVEQREQRAELQGERLLEL